MNKILASVLLFILAICALAACSSPESEGEEQEPNPGLQIVGIEISKQPNKTQFMLGEEFEQEGAELSYVYNDGSKQKIENSLEAAFSCDLTKAGERDVTVSFQNFETTMQVFVYTDDIVQIKVKSLPSSLKYKRNENSRSFRGAELEIVGVRENGFEFLLSPEYYNVDASGLEIQVQEGEFWDVDVKVSLASNPNVVTSFFVSKGDYCVVKNIYFDKTVSEYIKRGTNGVTQDEVVYRDKLAFSFTVNGVEYQYDFFNPLVLSLSNRSLFSMVFDKSIFLPLGADSGAVFVNGQHVQSGEEIELFFKSDVIDVTVLSGHLSYNKILVFLEEAWPTLYFDSLGGSLVAPQKLSALSEIEEPTREGYVFTGWFDPYSGQTFDPAKAYQEVSYTVFAMWLQDYHSAPVLEEYKEETIEGSLSSAVQVIPDTVLYSFTPKHSARYTVNGRLFQRSLLGLTEIKSDSVLAADGAYFIAYEKQATAYTEVVAPYVNVQFYNKHNEKLMERQAYLGATLESVFSEFEFSCFDGFYKNPGMTNAYNVILPILHDSAIYVEMSQAPLFLLTVNGIKHTVTYGNLLMGRIDVEKQDKYTFKISPLRAGESLLKNYIAAAENISYADCKNVIIHNNKLGVLEYEKDFDVSREFMSESQTDQPFYLSIISGDVHYYLQVHAK